MNYYEKTWNNMKSAMMQASSTKHKRKWKRNHIMVLTRCPYLLGPMFKIPITLKIELVFYWFLTSVNHPTWKLKVPFKVIWKLGWVISCNFFRRIGLIVLNPCNNCPNSSPKHVKTFQHWFSTLIMFLKIKELG
jgi:hypothetical protein